MSASIQKFGGSRMDRRIASPELRSDAGSRRLIETIDRICTPEEFPDAIVYYDFPMFRDDRDDLLRSQTLLVAPNLGLIFFSSGPFSDADAAEELQASDEKLGQLFALSFGRLIRNQKLRKNRNELVVGMRTCIYAPGLDVAGVPELESDILTSEAALSEFIRGKRGEVIGAEVWAELISTIEGASALRKDKERGLADARPGSRAAILNDIYSRIASFDQDQRRAAITLVDGPQRIRGIAGSGKTVVLAMKAAHIHLVKPEAKVLVTFWTKSLYDQFRYLVSKFYRQFSDRDPDWDFVQILHAWGGRSTGGGVYYNACVDSGATPLTLADIKRLGAKPSFDGACEELLKRNAIVQKYDYVLIDEGQDLPPSFYRLCFELAVGGPTDRNVIWAYDELQTILDVKVQNVRETFGLLPNDVARMDLVRAEDERSDGLQPHDIVLKKSYRNPAECLVVAHALGFGIYSKEIVQILENSKHWEDLGYSVSSGSCRPGEDVVITRLVENSPINVSSYKGAGSVFHAESFPTYRAEIEWVVAQFNDFLKDGIRPQDILIVSLDDRNAKKYFADISQMLLKSNVQVNNLSLPSFDMPNFYVEGAVTLATVYKAKGNEAAVVFVVGLDAIPFETDPVRARNKLFAALTRSRAWLRVSGVGEFALPFIEEMRTAIANFPNLVFKYPSAERVRMIQRDLAERSTKLARLQKIVEELGLTNLSDVEIARILRADSIRK